MSDYLPQLRNKAVFDYTLHPRCALPFSSFYNFPPIGDAAYRQHTGGGPSHDIDTKLVKIARVVEISPRTDSQTQTDILITILDSRVLSKICIRKNSLKILTGFWKTV